MIKILKNQRMSFIYLEKNNEERQEKKTSEQDRRILEIFLERG